MSIMNGTKMRCEVLETSGLDRMIGFVVPKDSHVFLFDNVQNLRICYVEHGHDHSHIEMRMAHGSAHGDSTD